MKEKKRLLMFLLDMGEALLNSGAEVYRAEDTISRIGHAYGAEDVNVFCLTSVMFLTVDYPDGTSLTQNRRVKKIAGHDFVKLEDLNTLSRRACSEKPDVEELIREFDVIVGRKPANIGMLLGYILVGGSFTVFFGGGVLDGIVGGIMGIFIWLLVKYLRPFCMNDISFNVVASFLTGAAICGAAAGISALKADTILIGDIMLLVPGLMFTNAFRDLLLGDTLSCVMRLVQAILLAVAMSGGFLAAIWLIRGAF